MASTTSPADAADEPGPAVDCDEQLRRFLDAATPFDAAGSAGPVNHGGSPGPSQGPRGDLPQGLRYRALAGRPAVHWGPTLDPDPGYTIRTLRFEGVHRLPRVPALLYEPTTASDNVGRIGVPNADDHHDAGVAVGYNSGLELVRRSCVVLNFEFIGMGELGAPTQPKVVLFDWRCRRTRNVDHARVILLSSAH